MAKNISLLGADYPDVPAVQLPQTGGGMATFYDIQVIDDLNSDSPTDALSAKQGKKLNSKNTITATKLWAADISITAESVNRIVTVAGWVKLNASQYTDGMPLFSLSKNPSNNIYFIDDKGEIYRLKTNGEVILHNGPTISTDQFRFFNFSYCS